MKTLRLLVAACASLQVVTGQPARMLPGFRENTYVTKYDSGKVHPDANGMEYIASKIYKDYGSWMEQ